MTTVKLHPYAITPVSKQDQYVAVLPEWQMHRKDVITMINRSIDGLNAEARPHDTCHILLSAHHSLTLPGIFEMLRFVFQTEHVFWEWDETPVGDNLHGTIKLWRRYDGLLALRTAPAAVSRESLRDVLNSYIGCKVVGETAGELLFTVDESLFAVEGEFRPCKLAAFAKDMYDEARLYDTEGTVPGPEVLHDVSAVAKGSSAAFTVTLSPNKLWAVWETASDFGLPHRNSLRTVLDKLFSGRRIDEYQFGKRSVYVSCEPDHCDAVVDEVSKWFTSNMLTAQ